jgi:crossover junction endodeoxyribonuclease RusA
MPEMTTTPKNNLSLLLTYPPSVNTYWGFHGHRRFLTKKALDFKANVAVVFSATNLTGFGNAEIVLNIVLHPPDRRVRDIDNVLKPLLDALVSAGVFNDDSQVCCLTVSRGTIVKGGSCEVCVELGKSLPLS